MITGVGLGFRQAIAEALFEAPPPALDWVEIHPENYMRRGGKFELLLADAASRWPIATHGLTMAFGSLSPFDGAYLHDLRRLLDEVASPWHSDHLCFAGTDGLFVHDLIPLPKSHESIDLAVDRIHQAQDALSRPVAIEHVSYYAEPPGAEMAEVDHLVEILERADAQLLLDVNNVFVNSQNHGFDPRAWIDRIPLERVVQLHVAGHQVRPDGLRIDTHAEPICEETFALLEYTLRALGRPIAVLLERDGNFPELSELSHELSRIAEIYQRVLGGSAPNERAESAAVRVGP